MKISKRQLRKIIKEAAAIERPEELLSGLEGEGELEGPMYPSRSYEDNQTKMVRRYLALRGEEEELERMSVEEIERLAADLRLLPPSTKKRWGIYDLRETRGKNRSLLKEQGDPIADEMLGDFLVDMAQELTDQYDPKDAHRIGSEEEFYDAITIITVEVEDLLRKRLSDLWSGDIRLEMMG